MALTDAQPEKRAINCLRTQVGRTVGLRIEYLFRCLVVGNKAPLLLHNRHDPSQESALWPRRWGARRGVQTFCWTYEYFLMSLATILASFFA